MFMLCRLSMLVVVNIYKMLIENNTKFIDIEEKPDWMYRDFFVISCHFKVQYKHKKKQNFQEILIIIKIIYDKTRNAVYI